MSPRLAHVLRQLGERFADEALGDHLGGGCAQVVAAADCECEAVALEICVGFEDDVCGAVVGAGVHGI